MERENSSGFESTPDFYQDILGRPLSDEEHAKPYINQTVIDLTGYYDKLIGFPGVEVIREIEPMMGGWQAVFRCPDGRILILWQEDYGRNRGVK